MANTMDQELYPYFLQLSEAEKKTVLQMLKNFVQGKKHGTERKALNNITWKLKRLWPRYEWVKYIVMMKL